MAGSDCGAIELEVKSVRWEAYLEFTTDGRGLLVSPGSDE
jgi:hypothetical protein